MILLRWVILAAVAIVALTLAAGLGLLAHLPDRGDRELLAFVGSLSLMVLISVPPVAGLLVAGLTIDPGTPDGRRAFGRLVLILTGIDLLAVVGCVAVGVAAPDAAPYLAAVVLIAGVLFVAAVRLGRRLRPRLVARTGVATEPWSPWPTALTRRKVATVVLVFGIGTAAGVAGALVIGRPVDADIAVLNTALSGVSLGLFAAALTSTVVSFPVVNRLNSILGQDYDEQQAITRRVLRGQRTELTEDGERRAVRYAQVASLQMRFQVAQSGFLFGGIWLQQSAILLRAPSSGVSVFGWVVVIGAPIFLAILVPLMVRQVRRATSYARAHAYLLPEAATEERRRSDGSPGPS